MDKWVIHNHIIIACKSFQRTLKLLFGNCFYHLFKCTRILLVLHSLFFFFFSFLFFSNFALILTIMDSPPFQVPVPPAVAKLIDGSKLQGLNSRLLDSDGNNGGVVTTGFGASPTFKTTGFMNNSGSNSNQNLASSNYNTVSSASDRENGPTPIQMDVVEEQNEALNKDSSFATDEKNVNVTLFLDDSKSKVSITEASRGNPTSIVGEEAKLSGIKRPFPNDDEPSVITIQEDSSSRERKPRDSSSINNKKSPKQVKPSGLQHFLDDNDPMQSSSNQGGSFTFCLFVFAYSVPNHVLFFSFSLLKLHRKQFSRCSFGPCLKSTSYHQFLCTSTRQCCS